MLLQSHPLRTPSPANATSSGRRQGLRRIPRPMRRLIALLILALLPIQWSWAEIASYCRHETAAVSQAHPGHHDAEHAAGTDGTEDGKRASPSDGGCSICHHHCVAAAVADDGATPFAFSSTGFEEVFVAVPRREPEIPFRPPLAARC